MRGAPQRVRKTVIGLFVVLLTTLPGLSKPHFSVNIPFLAGYRDHLWEIGLSPSLKFSAQNLLVALRAPLYLRVDNGHLDPWDWDEAGDYGRILDSFHLKAKGILDVKAGGFTHETVGLGGLIADYSTLVNHRHARSGFLVRLDLGYSELTIFAADITQGLDLTLLGSAVRPLWFLHGAVGKWRIELQLLLMTKPFERDEWDTLDLALGGFHPFLGMKKLTLGPYWVIVPDSYVLGIRGEGETRKVKWEFSTGLRLSKVRYTGVLVDTLFSEEQYGFLDKGPKTELWLQHNPVVRDSLGVASGFGSFSVDIKGVAQFWGRVDFDGVSSALYAGGGSVKVKGLIMRGAFAIRGWGMRVYSGELTYLFSSPFYASIVASHSCAYTKRTNSFEKINVLMGSVGVYLRW